MEDRCEGVGNFLRALSAVGLTGRSMNFLNICRGAIQRDRHVISNKKMFAVNDEFGAALTTFP